MQHADKRRKPQTDTAQGRTADTNSSASAVIHNSPRMVAQSRQLRSLFGSAVQYQATQDDEPLQGRLDTEKTVQREVKLSTAPWGPTKGKWVTTLDPGKPFDSQEAAQAREDEILAAQAAAQEAAWEAKAKTDAWEFRDQQGRLTAHFNDGWGASYGITSTDELRDHILDRVDRDDEEIGDGYEIDLGTRLNDEEHLSRPCKIIYDVVDVITVTAGPVTRDTVKRSVFHCGPTDQ